MTASKKNLKTMKLKPISQTQIEPVSVKHNRPVFAENPFLGFAVTAHKRSMTVSRGTVIKDEAGADQFETTIAQVKLVDEEQFIKLFTGQVSALFNLSSAGIKMFGLLLVEAQSKISEDLIFFSFSDAKDMAQKKKFSLSESSYTRGINDLIAAQIIAVSKKGTGWFFINPAIIFNGDRARFVTEYRKTKTKAINPNQQQISFDKNEEK